MSLFISLEGIEGCGKTTQARRLHNRLQREGFKCLLTREPGGTKIGREIRKVILAPKHRQMSAETELALYFADRAQHLREVIWPALKSGTIVITDRFIDSTIAYQGYGRGLPFQVIRTLDRLLTGHFKPHVTFFLDLTVIEGLTRARCRNRKSITLGREGRFENEDLEFHERVRSGYIKISRRERERYRIISANGSLRSVHEEIWQALTKSRKLPKKSKEISSS